MVMVRLWYGQKFGGAVMVLAEPTPNRTVAIPNLNDNRIFYYFRWGLFTKEMGEKFSGKKGYAFIIFRTWLNYI
jgi:hypothetical protein